MNEAVGRHNARQESTMENISKVARGMLGKRLSYKELTKELSPESEWVILLVCKDNHGIFM